MQNGCRTEKKYLISLATATILRARLLPLMRVDSQAVHGAYRIRSLYFDTPYADAFWEKVDGWGERCKYRLRFYNGDTSFIRLERKEKLEEMTRKTQARVDEPVAQAMQQGEYESLLSIEDPLCKSFYGEAKARKLVPVVTVEYRREPFVFPLDNVRITIDSSIYAGNPSTFLAPLPPPFPVLENGVAILEVKTDDRLPAMIGRVLESVPRQQQSYSKFALSYARLHGIE